MRREAPDELVLDYTRTMMGFLLFSAAPSAILMIGLGGGSMAKYIHRHLPQADLTVVEINQQVIDLRDDFLIPPDDARFRVPCADGAAFVAAPPCSYDVILIDGFTGEGMPEALCSRSFYRHCRAALKADGVLVANVQADTAHTAEVLRRLARAFAGGVIDVESDEGGNRIAIAALPAALQRCRAGFAQRCSGLADVHQATLATAAGRFERALAGWSVGPVVADR